MDILFWSGGKDAYMALQFHLQEYPERSLQLLTTYNEETSKVPHQNISLGDIKKQAAHLNIKLHCVPLPTNCPNKEYLQRLQEVLESLSAKTLIFGDWKNKEIRQWREEVFGELGYECVFPIWQKSIHELLPVLILKPIEIKISAVKEEFQSVLRVGETYDQPLITQLNHLPDIDPMGENGEFHTKVIFKDLKA